ncbi:MAG: DUF502 domain-containing protein [Candidatus Hydrogenedentes bacterium]|nr:DUF502 domain-containing protein [Candidatus Hydrogenedentota bacterium]
MNRIVRHIRHRLISGAIVLIPAGISLFVLSLLYRLTVGLVSSAVRPLFKELPGPAVAAISVFLLVTFLYLLGGLAANVFGRQILHAFERMIARVPIVDAVYGTAKQIVELFSAKPEAGRQTAVLVPFPHQDTRAMGFMTGEITLPSGERMATVFVPTTPNPTTGFLQMFPLADVYPLEADSDEAFQFIMSAGILRPPALREKDTP